MHELLGLSTAFVTTLLVGWPVLVLLRRRGVLDVPNARSSHARVTPRGGGIAVCVGAGLGLVVYAAPAAAWGVFAGAMVAAVVGFVDDLRGLSAVLRLAVQGLVSLALAVWLVGTADLGPLAWGAATLAATVWMTAYVNAFNFMDGINGISGVSAAAAGAWFLLLGGTGSVTPLAAGGAALLGAALGFLPWNTGGARMFLGDVGSYFLGIFVGALVVVGVVAGFAPPIVAAPLLPYLADTGWTLMRRLRLGHSGGRPTGTTPTSGS